MLHPSGGSRCRFGSHHRPVRLEEPSKREASCSALHDWSGLDLSRHSNDPTSTRTETFVLSGHSTYGYLLVPLRYQMQDDRIHAGTYGVAASATKS